MNIESDGIRAAVLAGHPDGAWRRGQLSMFRILLAVSCVALIALKVSAQSWWLNPWAWLGLCAELLIVASLVLKQANGEASPASTDELLAA